MNIISFEDKTLKLNSGILEENFGKMSFASIINEEGLLIHAKKSGNEYSFDYSPWTFNDVQSFDTETGRKVFFCGNSPFMKEPKTLADLLETDQSFSAGLAAIRILTEAALNNKEIPFTGGGSLLLELNDEDFTALLLPELLFTGAVACLSDEDKAYHINFFVNPTLSGNKAYRFARANLAYKIYTGVFPFQTVNTIERNADILDKKYLPLELAVEGINSELAKKINSELELNSAKVEIPGKTEQKEQKKISKIEKLAGQKITESDAQKAARLQAEYQKAISAFPFETFIACKETASKISGDELQQKARDFMSRKTKNVNTKRKIRRNTGVIATVSIVSVFLVIIIVNSIRTTKNNQTSKGLTAAQTVESFYQEINNLNTVFLDNITKGKHANGYANIVSQMYVVGKNRQAYSGDHGIVNAATFFDIVKEEKQINEAGLYSVTGLKIDGKPCDMNIQLPIKKEKPEPIKEDKGITVYDKMQSIQTATFYMIHTEGPEILCEEHKDVITLTFLKDRWVITDIVPEETIIEIDSQKFFQEYFTVLKLAGNDQRAACRILKGTYPWLPSLKDFENQEAKKLAEQAAFNTSFGITNN